MEFTKTYLRKEYLQKRKELPEAEFERINQSILSYFKSIDFSAIRCIHLFLSIVEKHEVNTSILIDFLKKNHPHIQIAVPQSNFSSLTLTHFLLDDDLVIEKNHWNIPEPVKGNRVEASTIDLVLVPLLAIDKRGYRVGYGKGFYDRFLIECRTDVKTIGLSQFDPVEVIQNRDKYDFPLKACITPSGIINFAPLL